MVCLCKSKRALVGLYCTGQIEALPNHAMDLAEYARTFQDLRELHFLTFEGTDRRGRLIIRIVGKYFPAPVVDNVRLKNFITHKIREELPPEGEFCIVYFHAGVSRKENCPGVMTLRWLYETLPQEFRQRLQVFHFVHPGILSRTIMGTLGRLFLSEGLYYKLNYISRIEFLWDHVKKSQMEVPDFVFSHDLELEYRPLMDYWIDSDPVNSCSNSTRNRDRSILSPD